MDGSLPHGSGHLEAASMAALGPRCWFHALEALFPRIVAKGVAGYFRAAQAARRVEARKAVQRHDLIKESGDSWNRIIAMWFGDFDSSIIPSSRAWIAVKESLPLESVVSECQVEGWAIARIIAQQAVRARLSNI